MLTRRQFVKIGSLFLPAISVFCSNPVLASSWWAMLGSGAVGTSWATWDGVTESGYGDADVGIWVFDSGLNQNEDGEGGELAGANLILTQVGSVAAASGGYRQLDGADDLFSATEACIENFVLDTTWAIHFKISTWADAAAHDVQLLRLANADNKIMIGSSGGKLWGRIQINAGAVKEGTTANDIPLAGELHIGMWADAGATVHLAMHTSRITSWAAVAAGDKVEIASGGDFTGRDFSTERAIGGQAGANCCNVKLGYFVMSKSVLAGA